MPCTNKGLFINRLKLFAFVMFTLFTSSIYAAEQSCVDCGSKASASAPKVTGDIEKMAMEAGTKEEGDMIAFCLNYKHIERNFVLSHIKMIEADGYSVDDVLQAPVCENQGYSSAVKSPILHLSADNPIDKAAAIEIIYKYYTIKRKQPELWLKAINAKNTKGETFLDYVEYLKKSEYFSRFTKNESLENLVTFVCSNGGVYSVYKDKTCPVP